MGEQEEKPVSELFHEDINAMWAEIYQPDVSFQGGIALQQSIIYDDKIFQELSEKQQKELYVSKLKNLVENEKIWKSLGIISGNTQYYDIDVVKECYEDAKKNEKLMTKNYCISGKRDQVLSYLDNKNIQSLYVDEVRLCAINNN